MVRVEEIINKYGNLSAEIFQKSKELLLKEYQGNREEILENLKDVFRYLCMKAYEMQEYGQKEVVSIISFFYLNSSLLTGSHKYLISLYDKTFYLDQSEVSITYCPEFIIPYFLSDIQLLENDIRKHYIRIKSYEMERIKFLHIQHYYELMKEIFCSVLDEIKNLPEYNIMKKSTNPLFLYGGYRDYAINLEEFYAALSNRS
ncbi:MAG: hypothetical protein HFI50_09585 [Lachnospiraceae bacterium]|nr:hypothetical protein [Lachnospiraceae bacterium]